mmetsp:Transcript_55707/g.155255  ORF Transcript_55707/g.155255 Transcript_55707/m.155255 type:complete len:201 (-) Transcript_55707:536-1138(-)
MSARTVGPYPPPNRGQPLCIEAVVSRAPPGPRAWAWRLKTRKQQVLSTRALSLHRHAFGEPLASSLAPVRIAAPARTSSPLSTAATGCSTSHPFAHQRAPCWRPRRRPRFRARQWRSQAVARLPANARVRRMIPRLPHAADVAPLPATFDDELHRAHTASKKAATPALASSRPWHQPAAQAQLPPTPTREGRAQAYTRVR